MKLLKDYKKNVQAAAGDVQSLLGEFKKLERAFLEHEEALGVISEFTYAWEYWQAPDGSYRYVSPSCQEITGYQPEDFYENKDLLQKIIFAKDWQRWLDHAHTMVDEDNVQPLEFKIRTKSGNAKWIQHVCRPVLNNVGENIGVRGSNRDISDMKSLQEKIKHMAGHDYLTGLANRTLFLAHLEQTLKSAARNRSNFMLVFIDLDNFKDINDKHGHFAGDEVLKRVANDLQSVGRQDDIIARFGGDEFVGIFRFNVEGDVQRIKEKIFETINTQIVCYHLEIVFSFSMGMSLYPSDGTSVDKLINKAEREMFAVKASKKELPPLGAVKE